MTIQYDNTNTQISAVGAAANIPIVFQTKGTGALDFSAGSTGINISNGNTVTAITRTAGGTGYTTAITATISAPQIAGGVQATAIAYAGAVTTVVTSGGTGYTLNDVITVVGGTGIQSQSYTVSGVSGGVITAVTVQNFGRYTVLPTNPVSVTGGTGSGATLTLSNWSMTEIAVNNAGSGYVEQPTVTFSGGGGSGAAAYATVGSGTTVRSLGSTLDFSMPSGVNFRVGDAGATSSQYWQAIGGAFTGILRSTGATQNGQIQTGGTGAIQFLTNNGAQEQFRVTHTASAVNYVQVTGAATTARPTISAQGSDTNIGMNFIGKGSARIAAFFNNATNSSFHFSIGVGGATNAVNYFDVSGSAAGSAPVLSSQGSDTNIDLALTPKGTGLVRFGTYTNTVSTIAGYIEIKDSGGTTRRLAVVS